MTVEQLWTRLVDAGLWSTTEAASERSSVPPDADVEAVVADLVHRGRVTKFQIERVTGDPPGVLVLGNYVLLDKIGAGGMGEVFKAEHRRMKRLVALKVLPQSVTEDADSLGRFQREVEAVSRLSHPNIVAAHDADEAKGVHFFVMEFIVGEDLSRLVRRAGAQPLGTAMQLTMQAARGLEYAHARGIVHRDIKPSNLLLDREGHVKILDMGLARIDEPGAEAAGALTTTGMVMGTIDYMSPEQALDAKQAGPQSDIYSLGCTLYFLVAGRPPFDGETVMQKLLAHRESPIPSYRKLLSTSGHDVADDPEATVRAEAFDDILRRMLAKKPGDRFATMTEVIAALETSIAAKMSTVIRSAAVAARRSVSDSATEAGIAGPNVPSRGKTALDTDTTPSALGETLANHPVGLRQSLSPDSPAGLENRPSNRAPLRFLKAFVVVLVAATLLTAAITGWQRIQLERGIKSDGAATSGVVIGSPPTPASTSTNSNNFALKFENGTFAQMPAPFEGLGDLTLEAWITPSSMGDRHLIAVGSEQVKIKQNPQENGRATVTGAFAADLADDDRANYGWETSDSITIGKPFHYAVVRRNGQIASYFNGRGAGQRASWSQSGQVDPPLRQDVNFPINVHMWHAGGLPGREFDGLVDEVRISNIARYDSDFTPQLRFEPDENTLGLYHFDEGAGSTLTDSSGHARHGTISHPNWVRAPDITVEASPASGSEAPTAVYAGIRIFPKRSRVQLDVPFEGEGDVTIEVWAIPDRCNRFASFIHAHEFDLWFDTELPGGKGLVTGYFAKWDDNVSAAHYGRRNRTPVVSDQRHHLALVRSGGSVLTFVNGKGAGDVIGWTDRDDLPKLKNAKLSLQIPWIQLGTNGFAGVIDEARISNSARYTEDFTPQDSFDPDQATLALYHCDEASGNQLRDSSGHHHHVELVGTEWVRFSLNRDETGTPVFLPATTE